LAYVCVVRRREPVVRPALDRLDHLVECAALRRELVADSHRSRRLDGASDDVRLLELAQALGERPGRDSRQGALQLGEAQRAGKQRPRDRAAPAASDQLDGVLEVGAELNVDASHVLTSSTKRGSIAWGSGYSR